MFLGRRLSKTTKYRSSFIKTTLSKSHKKGQKRGFFVLFYVGKEGNVPPSYLDRDQGFHERESIFRGLF
jgi:hypothetical protein